MTPAFEVHLGRDPETNYPLGCIHVHEPNISLGLDILDLMRHLRSEYPEMWNRVSGELPLSVRVPELREGFLGG